MRNVVFLGWVHDWRQIQQIQTVIVSFHLCFSDCFVIFTNLKMCFRHKIQHPRFSSKKLPSPKPPHHICQVELSSSSWCNCLLGGWRLEPWTSWRDRSRGTRVEAPYRFIMFNLESRKTMKDHERPVKIYKSKHLVVGHSFHYFISFHLTSQESLNPAPRETGCRFSPLTWAIHSS